MKNRFGTLDGYPVYKVSTQTFINNECYKDKDNIYLIDRDLILNNKIVAYWDGKEVHAYDSHKQTTFYNVNLVKKQVKPEEELVEPTSSTATAEDILAGVYAWQIG